MFLCLSVVAEEQTGRSWSLRSIKLQPQRYCLSFISDCALIKEISYLLPCRSGFLQCVGSGMSRTETPGGALWPSLYRLRTHRRSSWITQSRTDDVSRARYVVPADIITTQMLHVHIWTDRRSIVLKAEEQGVWGERVCAAAAFTCQSHGLTANVTLQGRWRSSSLCQRAVQRQRGLNAGASRAQWEEAEETTAKRVEQPSHDYWTHAKLFRQNQNKKAERDAKIPPEKSSLSSHYQIRALQTTTILGKDLWPSRQQLPTCRKKRHILIFVCRVFLHFKCCCFTIKNGRLSKIFIRQQNEALLF